MKILITGSEGLVGTELRKQLLVEGHKVLRFDVKLSSLHDLESSTGRDKLMDMVSDDLEIDGIVHLAACTRVAKCEDDPFRAVSLNVGGVEAAIRAAAAADEREPSYRPWLLFTSSREVYGNEHESLAVMSSRVREGKPLSPINTYARTKALGEDLVMGARWKYGLRTSIVRLSSVYGSAKDHPDRVVPAMARAAANGGPIVLYGDKIFDYVHVIDAARGLRKACEALHRGTSIPPVHLVTGVGTSLVTMARLAIELAKKRGKAVGYTTISPHRYEVSSFVGHPGLAKDLFGWQAEIGFESGFRKLVDDFAAEGG